MQDIRDLLAWVYNGHFDAILAEQGPHRVDVENVAAFGTSSGGQLALGLVCFLLPCITHTIYERVGQTIAQRKLTNTGLQHT